MDIYVSGYTIFYLTEVSNNGSWLSQVFTEAKRNMNVSITSNIFITKLKISFSGPVNVAYAETMGYKPSSDKGLENR